MSEKTKLSSTFREARSVSHAGEPSRVMADTPSSQAASNGAPPGASAPKRNPAFMMMGKTDKASFITSVY